MAQAQRTPERQTESERVVETLRDLVRRLETTRLTPESSTEARSLLERMLEMVQRTGTRGQTVTQQTQGTPLQRPAPRRTEQFVYDISMGGRTYRIAMADPLPAGPAAQRRLHDLLLNNRLVRRETPNDPSSPVLVLAQVTMPGATPAAQRFNAGVPNQRLDLFRDAYLGQTYRDGRYVPNAPVTIVEVPREGGTRRL